MHQAPVWRHWLLGWEAAAEPRAGLPFQGHLLAGHVSPVKVTVS